MKKRKFLLFLLLCFTILSSSAQISNGELKENIAKMDSQTNELNKSLERNMHRIDSIEMVRSVEQMGRNMSSFMAQRSEQERKEKRQAYLRIGFGVLMLIILVIGLRRKKKQAL